MAKQFLEVSSSRIDIEPLNGVFRDTTRATAKAATRSIKKVSGDIVKKGRADIAASGKFRGKWVSAFKSSVKPSRPSNGATAYIRHAMGGIAAVNEFGATIHGKPLMWLPLPGVPKKTTLGTDFASGRAQAVKMLSKPSVVSQAKGGLIYRKAVGSKYPQLGITTGKGKRAKFKPLFIGIPTVRIKPKWHLTNIALDGAASLPDEFERQLGDI